MSKSTHRENERLRKMQERVDFKAAARWRADFQHVLDCLEYLGLVEKITPVDGMPEHMVIELADGGGWLYYDGPDRGLRTLTAKQARHYMSCEAERHVEEGVWA